MRALLFDLDGVLYQGNEAIPGALETLQWVQAQRIPHRFITNTTSKPRGSICQTLAGMGIQVDAEHILSPPVAAAHWLESHAHGPVALWVPEGTRSEFAAVTPWSGDPGQAVSAVVIGDLAEDWDFSRLNQAFRCLLQKPAPTLIALGMTRYWKAGSGLQLDVGPFVVALQYATGIEPLVMGKPAASFFQSAADNLGMAPQQILMIGDDIRGDVEGAQNAGMHAALVKTGKFQVHDLDGPIRPDLLLDSIAELPAWWEQHCDDH